MSKGPLNERAKWWTTIIVTAKPILAVVYSYCMTYVTAWWKKLMCAQKLRSSQHRQREN